MTFSCTSRFSIARISATSLTNFHRTLLLSWARKLFYYAFILSPLFVLYMTHPQNTYITVLRSIRTILDITANRFLQIQSLNRYCPSPQVYISISYICATFDHNSLFFEKPSQWCIRVTCPHSLSFHVIPYLFLSFFLSSHSISASLSLSPSHPSASLYLTLCFCLAVLSIYSSSYMSFFYNPLWFPFFCFFPAGSIGMLALLLLAEKALGGASNYAVYIKVDCIMYNVISECAQNACSELYRNIFRFYGNLFCTLQKNSEHHRNVFRML